MHRGKRWKDHVLHSSGLGCNVSIPGILQEGQYFSESHCILRRSLMIDRKSIDGEARKRIIQSELDIVDESLVEIRHTLHSDIVLQDIQEELYLNNTPLQPSGIFSKRHL